MKSTCCGWGALSWLSPSSRKIPFTVTDADGKPVAGEFSVALVDEAEKGNHIRERISVRK